MKLFRSTTLALVTSTALLLACSGTQTSTNTTGAGDNNNATPLVTTPEAGSETTADSTDAMTVEDSAAPTTSALDASVLLDPSADAGASDGHSAADAGRADARATGSRPRTTGTTGTSTTTTTATSATADPAVAEGRAVFDRTCGRCHPGGAARVGPRLSGRADTEAAVRRVVRSGEGTMRPIPTSRLSDGDLAKVLVFLRSIRAVR
jgi:mono/diheme cytochrome c family protein